MVDIFYPTPAVYLTFLGLKNSEPINSLINQFKAEKKEEEFHVVNIIIVIYPTDLAYLIQQGV